MNRILPTILLLMICCAAFTRVAGTTRGIAAGGMDSAAAADSLVAEADSLAVVADSLATEADSLATKADSLATDSAAALPAVEAARTLTTDSLAADTLATDSARIKRTGIDAPVHFVATDSMIYVAKTRLAYLYGKADVSYQNMQLTSDHMTLNMDSSMVRAYSAEPDSLGKRAGRAVYKQGGDEYESDDMAFNFKSKRGFIHNVTTEQGDGFMQSDRSRRDEDGTVYMEKARYTTCDDEHPHFYLRLTRAKVKPGKEAIFAPAYLVVEDVPLPLAIPYGFFPFNKKYSSGFIMPSIGEETRRGFYLREGGYYFAINDYIDLKALGEIYTGGSWGVSAETNYRKRYDFSGNLYVNFITTVDGEKNMPDYNVSKDLKVQWSHRMENSAARSYSFSARVNFASQSFEKKNLDSQYNPLSYSQSTRASSISWSKTFQKIGLSISASANLTQNMRDSSLTVTLPDVSINLARIYPFKRKHRAGKERWYEKISFSYTGQISNSFSGKEADFLKSNILKNWRNGMQHRIPVDATFQLFKYINITPSFSFHDVMYKEKVMRSWDQESQREVRDTIYGFNNLYDWNAALSLNTTLYGFYTPAVKFLQKKIIKVRHVFKPNVSISYAPDFTKESYGYQASYVRTDRDGNVSTVSYSPYQGMMYGYPSSGQQGLISFGISNNLEMKVRTDRDSTGERKISLIDELGANMSYNLAAKTKPWSDLSMRLRLKITKSYTFSMNATFATYAYEFNDKGQVVVGDRTEYSYGRFGRFQGFSQNISYTLDNRKVLDFWQKLTGQKPWREKKNNENDKDNDDFDDDDIDPNVDPELQKAQKVTQKTEKAKVDADGYLAFSIPWSISFSYGITMSENRQAQINERRMRYPYHFTHTLSFSGYVRIAEGWNITWSSGWDFGNKQFAMTTASVSRDLHCFEMQASVVLAPYTSYHFTFRAKASMLADALKYEKRSSYSSNVQWY